MYLNNKFLLFCAVPCFSAILFYAHYLGPSSINGNMPLFVIKFKGEMGSLLCIERRDDFLLEFLRKIQVILLRFMRKYDGKRASRGVAREFIEMP